MEMKWRRHVLEILIEGTGCVYTIWGCVLCYCVFPDWPCCSHAGVSVSQVRQAHSWLGVFAVVIPAALECTSLSPKPKIFEWLAFLHSRPAHLSLPQAIPDHSVVQLPLKLLPHRQPISLSCFIFLRTLITVCLLFV